MKKNYSFEISVKNFWSIGVPVFFLLTLILIVVGFITVDKVIMPKVTNLQNKGEVVVPDIVGFSLEDATAKLYAIGLHLSEDTKEYSDKPLKEILLQQPVVGKKVKSGRHLFVTVSRGPEIAVLPSVDSLAEGPAKSVLRKAGFRNIVVYQKYDEKVERNLAIRTEPAAKLQTSREAKIFLFMSKGLEPTHMEVPNLVGDILSSAESKINDAELKVGKVVYATSAIMGPGQVISQSLTPGSNVSLKSRVNLVVAAQ